MTAAVPDALRAETIDALRAAGARFALLVLNGAPLELAGRITLDGAILFDDDPPARVRWVATTRKIYADEQPRLERSHREVVESLRRGR